MKHEKPNHYSTLEREYLTWYLGTRPRPFDPKPFVTAARNQWGDRPELVHALAFCTRQWPESELYTHLFDPSLEHRQGVKWRNAGGRDLKVPGVGEVLVDLKSNIADPHHFVIGGIEYLDRVFDPAYDEQPVSYFRVVR